MTKILTASALAALALLGAAGAAPTEAATLSAAAKTALAGVAANPTGEEKALLALMEQVAPGSVFALLNAARGAPNTLSLATTLEALTAANPSLLAVFQETVASFVADPRLAPVAASIDCASDAASLHNIVRIWCGLAAVDPYPVVP